MNQSRKPPLKLTLNGVIKASITHVFVTRQLVYLTVILLFTIHPPVFAGSSATEAQREQFKIAWAAAQRGDHDSFRQIKDDLKD